MLRVGAALGYTVVALDRPGYGASAPYPDAMQRPEQRVALAYGAVDKILGASPRGAGLFLLGHSAGCELAVRMAADERAEQASVIGLELAGTGVQYHPATAEILKTATATERPSGSARHALAARAPVSGRRAVRNDELDDRCTRTRSTMIKKWPQQDFPALAARVSVPVQFSVAEHERVWRSDPETLAEIGAMFSSVAAVRDQRTGRHGTQSVPFGQRRRLPHEGAVVRRGMCCRATEHIEGTGGGLMRVGFIGLGSQGGPMARRIVEGGYETTLWARRAASLEPYADTAAKTAGSPAELAAASDLVCLCVVGDDDVREVLYGETGVLAGLASGGNRRHPQHRASRHLPRDRREGCRTRGFGDRRPGQRWGACRGGRQAAGHGRWR